MSSFALADKSNVSPPPGMRQFEQHQEFVKEISTNAGDAVIFTEVRANCFLTGRLPLAPAD